MTAVFTELNTDSEVRCLIIACAGDHCCAADVSNMGGASQAPRTTMQTRETTRYVHQFIHAILT